MGKKLDLALIISADGKQVTGEVKRLSGGLKDTAAEAEKANNSTGRLGNSVRRLGGLVATYLSARAIFGFTSAIVQGADNMALLEARTKLATERTGDFNVVYGQLYGLSQRNSQAFSETVALYQNLSRTAPELAKSTTEILRLTDSVQKLGRISGATQQAQQDALRQFSQSMSGGVIRAEEFNSIIENTPALANAIAEGLGTTVGQLRLAVVEGKVLSEDVFDALASQAEEIDRQFANMPKTTQQLATEVQNSFGLAASAIDKATGATNLWHGALELASSVLEEIARSADFDGYIKSLQDNQAIATEIARIEKERSTYIQNSYDLESGLSFASKDVLANYDKQLEKLTGMREQREAESRVAAQVNVVDKELLVTKRSIAQLDTRQLGALRAQTRSAIEKLNAAEEQSDLSLVEQARLKGSLGLLQAIVQEEGKRGQALEKQAQSEAKKAAARAASKTATAARKVETDAGANARNLESLERDLLNEEDRIRASYERRQQIVAANEGQADPARLEQIRERLAIEESTELAALVAKEERKREARVIADTQEQIRLAEKYGLDIEAEELRYQLEQERLAQRRETGVVNQQTFDAYLQTAELNHQKQLQKIRDTADKRALAQRNTYDKRSIAARRARQQVEQNIAVQEFRFAQNVFSQLLSGAAQHNKEAFEADKIARIATAGINAHTAASQALAAFPPPWNVGAAAAAYALGLVQVNAIRSQKFQGGGSSGGGSGGGSFSGGGSAPSTTPVATPVAPPAAVTAPDATPPTLATETAPEQLTREVRISLRGNTIDREQLQELIASINDETDQGTEIVLDPEGTELSA